MVTDEVNYQAIYDRIKQMVKTDYRRQQDLTDYLGYKRQILQDWSKGYSHPSLNSLIKISKYFGVPLEYVISGEESPIDDATAAFLISTQGLTEEQKRAIYASVKAQVEFWKNENASKSS